MKLIVGLGNPGRRYRSTPHNTGYHVVDELAARYKLSWRQARKLDAEFAEGNIRQIDCMLLKPTTYMNLSGEAVAPLVRGERLKVQEDLLVVYDDVALPFGRLRIRADGSSGGHRGMESIIAHLKTQQFARLRCGVGPGEQVDDLARYVLASWPKSLRDEVEAMMSRAADAVETWLTNDLTTAMNLFNVREPRINSD